MLNVDPPLVAGQKVVATVDLCSVKKDSLPLTVLPAPKSVPPPEIVKPLIACELLVNVTDCIPGAEIRVFAESGGNTVLIGVIKTLATSTTVPITPALKVGWSVRATQKVGGVTSPASRPIAVTAPPVEIPAPALAESILACSRCLLVENAVSGARIDVYQNNVWVGAANAAGPKEDVPVYPSLTAGASISATQTVCGQVSKAAEATVTGFHDKVPPPQLLSAFANKSFVEATSLLPCAIVEIEEVSVYRQVVGKTCASANTAAIGLNLPLFVGASLAKHSALNA